MTAWSRSCCQLPQWTVIWAGDASTAARRLSLSAASHRSGMPGRMEARARSTCGQNECTCVASSEKRRAAVAPMESPIITTSSYPSTAAESRCRYASAPLSPPPYQLRHGSTTYSTSNFPATACSASRATLRSSPAQLGTPGALPKATTSTFGLPSLCSCRPSESLKYPLGGHSPAATSRPAMRETWRTSAAAAGSSCWGPRAATCFISRPSARS
mmetsp:Transcript_33450/g.79344  ORF Transcript_33450/g.79344 Transcript_33450/m.79344 type:complete len:215 (+) Transcript_33450:185-829(+)